MKLLCLVQKRCTFELIHGVIAHIWKNAGLPALGDIGLCETELSTDRLLKEAHFNCTCSCSNLLPILANPSIRDQVDE